MGQRGLRNGASAKVWLALLKEGGRYTCSEADELIGHQEDSLRSVLDGLVVTGSLHKYDPPAGRLGTKFGVTGACKVPNGVTIGDILACNLQETDA